MEGAGNACGIMPGFYMQADHAVEHREAVTTDQSRFVVLGVLLLAYILSFVDRNVMAVLIGPIREDFRH